MLSNINPKIQKQKLLKHAAELRLHFFCSLPVLIFYIEAIAEKTVSQICQLAPDISSSCIRSKKQAVLTALQIPIISNAEWKIAEETCLSAFMNRNEKRKKKYLPYQAPPLHMLTM